MGIISWIIIGALAGWIASMIMGNNENQGAIGNIIVGILGAFVGGFVMDAIGGDGEGGLIYTILVAIGGACIVLFIKLRLLKV